MLILTNLNCNSRSSVYIIQPLQTRTWKISDIGIGQQTSHQCSTRWIVPCTLHSMVPTYRPAMYIYTYIHTSTHMGLYINIYAHLYNLHTHKWLYFLYYTVVSCSFSTVLSTFTFCNNATFIKKKKKINKGLFDRMFWYEECRWCRAQPGVQVLVTVVMLWTKS